MILFGNVTESHQKNNKKNAIKIKTTKKISFIPKNTAYTYCTTINTLSNPPILLQIQPAQRFKVHKDVIQLLIVSE